MGTPIQLENNLYLEEKKHAEPLDNKQQNEERYLIGNFIKGVITICKNQIEEILPPAHSLSMPFKYMQSKKEAKSLLKKAQDINNSINQKTAHHHARKKALCAFIYDIGRIAGKHEFGKMINRFTLALLDRVPTLADYCERYEVDKQGLEERILQFKPKSDAYYTRIQREKPQKNIWKQKFINSIRKAARN